MPASPVQFTGQSRKFTAKRKRPRRAAPGAKERCSTETPKRQPASGTGGTQCDYNGVNGAAVPLGLRRAAAIRCEDMMQMSLMLETSIPGYTMHTPYFLCLRQRLKPASTPRCRYAPRHLVQGGYKEPMPVCSMTIHTEAAEPIWSRTNASAKPLSSTTFRHDACGSACVSRYDKHSCT
jgi:hypothetical protein